MGRLASKSYFPSLCAKEETLPVVDTHAHFWARPSASPGADGAEDPVSAEQLLSAMEQAGVDQVIQVTRAMMGYDNRYSLEGAARHPDKVRVLGRFDPTAPNVGARLRSWVDQPYMIGIRLMLIAPPADRWLADGTLEAFWAEAEELDVPVAVYAPHQLKLLAGVGVRHPGLRLLVDHLGLRLFRVNEAPSPFADWKEIFGLLVVPNVYLKLSGLPEATAERYPFPRAREYVREVYERFVADRLMWGSNYPVTLRVCSYGEALDLVRVACDFISAGEREKILGGTAKRVLRLPW